MDHHTRCKFKHYNLIKILRRTQFVKQELLKVIPSQNLLVFRRANLGIILFICFSVNRLKSVLATTYDSSILTELPPISVVAQGLTPSLADSA